MIENYSPVSLALFGGGITFAFTALGSALVFFFMSEIKPKLLATMYGFAAGVMTAASFWSLLAPSIELSENTNLPNWLIPAAGFLLGAFFIWVLDKVMPHMHIVNGNEETEGAKVQLSKSILLFLAITLHNIPEGLAVGVTFGAFSVGDSGVTFNAALALALGIGLQNFPEGAAVSIPLLEEGYSKNKAFWFGTLTGLVEPIAAVIGILLSFQVTQFMPWGLSFAAGCMIYVVIEDLFPELFEHKDCHFGIWAFIVGFVLMMILDSISSI